MLVTPEGHRLAGMYFKAEVSEQPVEGFWYSLDASLLAGMFQSRSQGQVLMVLDANTCAVVRRVELDPHVLRIPDFQPTGEAAGWARAAEHTLRWQWLPQAGPCPSLVIWAQQRAHGGIYTCGVMAVSVGSGSVHHLDLPCGWDSPLRQPVWGPTGALAAIGKQGELVLVVPKREWGAGGYLAECAQLVEPEQCASNLLRPGWRGSSFRQGRPAHMGYAWGPSCYLAVVTFDRDRSCGNTLVVHIVDGRSGQVTAEHEVTRQRNLCNHLLWVHVQWSESGHAVCVSMAQAEFESGPHGHICISKFVLSFD